MPLNDIPVVLRSLSIGAVFCVTTGLMIAATPETAPGRFSREQLDFFEKQVQPILSENCYKCHSHQAEKIKGGLVLDSREAVLTGGDTGPAIVPSEPTKSLLIQAVRQVDEDLKMPPKKKLSEAQITTLTDWVKMGAPFPAPAGDAAAATK